MPKKTVPGGAAPVRDGVAAAGKEGSPKKVKKPVKKAVGPGPAGQQPRPGSVPGKTVPQQVAGKTVPGGVARKGVPGASGGGMGGA